MCSDKINDAVFWNRSLEGKFRPGSGNDKNPDEMIAFAETNKLGRSSCCWVLFPLIGAPSWNESDWMGGHRCSLWRCGICPAGRVSDYALLLGCQRMHFYKLGSPMVFPAIQKILVFHLEICTFNQHPFFWDLEGWMKSWLILWGIDLWDWSLFLILLGNAGQV